MNIHTNYSLKSLNTFGMDVYARQFASFENPEQLLQLQEVSNEFSKCMVLGGGSNILFTKNADRLVIKNEIRGIEIVKEDGDDVYIKVGAGVVWHQFVMYCIENGFAGIENLALIPGNIGASPMQNIGAYGVEIKDVFYSLEAYHKQEAKTYIFYNKDCEFGYRESVFKKKYKDQFIINRVTYKLSKKPAYNIEYGAIKQQLEIMGCKDLSIKNIAAAVIAIRTAKLPDPKKIGNAGSFFKNPEISDTQFEQLKKEFPNMVGYPVKPGLVKLAAGWLIEQCGWKGYREGDAGCHPLQALVLVNYGNANGQEIFLLSEKILKSVFQKFQVTLEREVNIL
ncbi:MAG: UDP-N-acetylmuramate dehydrogenase [Niastella sp.]|nr:UDP-N-acetylmuramate dehydrogenase [Niastella sp.]